MPIDGRDVTCRVWEEAPVERAEMTMVNMMMQEGKGKLIMGGRGRGVGGRGGKCHFLGILCFVIIMTLVVIGEGAVIGIDFGTHSYKVTLVQRSFQTVLNEQSARKTPTLVAFRGSKNQNQGDLERLFGSAAFNAVCSMMFFVLH